MGTNNGLSVTVVREIEKPTTRFATLIEVSNATFVNSAINNAQCGSPPCYKHLTRVSFNGGLPSIRDIGISNNYLN